MAPIDNMPDPPPRYRRYSDCLRQRFGCRVHRIPLDAGLTCPTRDGTISRDGCLYCDARGSSSLPPGHPVSVHEQLLAGLEHMRRRRRGARQFIAYFQAFSNTYAPVERLRELYTEAVGHPDIIGLSIGTRPDCVNAAILDLIASFTPRYDVWIEYGLQSSHDETLRRINRGHTAAQFEEAVMETRKRGIKTSAHLILGLPGETKEMLLQTADFVSRLSVDAVKIHLFHVLKNSALEKQYQAGEITLLAEDEYVGLACDFVERLSPAIIIQRLTGEAPEEHLVAPRWALDKQCVLRAIGQELQTRGSWQGILGSPPSSIEDCARPMI